MGLLLGGSWIAEYRNNIVAGKQNETDKNTLQVRSETR